MAVSIPANPFVLTRFYIETGRFYLENQISEEEAKDLVELTIGRLTQIEQPSLSKYTLTHSFLTDNSNRHDQAPDRI